MRILQNLLHTIFTVNGGQVAKYVSSAEEETEIVKIMFLHCDGPSSLYACPTRQEDILQVPG